MQSPLLGFNNNVKHRGKLFHIQTEDSGIRHPHVITHLFMDGGRILKTVKTSYAEHLSNEKLSAVVRDLMKQQHKMMFIALRDGQFDYVLDPDDAPPVSRAGGNSTPRESFQPAPVPAAAAAATKPVPEVKEAVEPPRKETEPARVVADPARTKESTPAAHRRSQRREAPEFLGTSQDAAKVNVVPPAPASASPSQTPPATKKEPNDKPSSGRYAASRPAAIFANGRAPEAGGSIFGDDLISEKSLDEVILSYLSDDLDTAGTKK